MNFIQVRLPEELPLHPLFYTKNQTKVLDQFDPAVRLFSLQGTMDRVPVGRYLPPGSRLRKKTTSIIIFYRMYVIVFYRAQVKVLMREI